MVGRWSAHGLHRRSGADGRSFRFFHPAPCYCFVKVKHHHLDARLCHPRCTQMPGDVRAPVGRRKTWREGDVRTAPRRPLPLPTAQPNLHTRSRLTQPQPCNHAHATTPTHKSKLGEHGAARPSAGTAPCPPLSVYTGESNSSWSAVSWVYNAHGAPPCHAPRLLARDVSFLAKRRRDKMAPRAARHLAGRARLGEHMCAECGAACARPGRRANLPPRVHRQAPAAARTDGTTKWRQRRSVLMPVSVLLAPRWAKGAGNGGTRKRNG